MRILRFVYALLKYLIFGNRVSKEIYKTRITLCNSCEHLNGPSCNLCGCYIKHKAKWSTESCPDNKW